MAVLNWISDIFKQPTTPFYNPTPIQETVSMPTSLPYIPAPSGTTSYNLQSRPSQDFVGPMPLQPTPTLQPRPSPSFVGPMPIQQQTPNVFFGDNREQQAIEAIKQISESYLNDNPISPVKNTVSYIPPTLTQSTRTDMAKITPGFMSTSRDWFKDTQENKSRESMSNITRNYMADEQARTRNADLEQQVKNLQLSITEYNKNIENYYNKPAISRTEKEIKKFESQREAILSDLDTRTNVLKTEGGSSREVPATFETVSTMTLLSPSGSEANNIKVKFVPAAEEVKRFETIRTSQPTLWNNKASQASRSQKVENIFKQGVSGIRTELTENNTVIVEPDLTQRLISISQALENDISNYELEKDKYETDIKQFLSRYPTTYDPEIGMTMINADPNTFDQAGLDVLNARRKILENSLNPLLERINDRNDLSKELDLKQYKYSKFLNAEQDKLTDINNEDKLQLVSNYYMDKNKDDNFFVAMAKSLPIGGAKSVRGILKFGLVNPAKIVVQDIKNPLSTSDTIKAYLLSSPFSRGIYDPFRQDPNVPWYKEVDTDAAFGALDTVLIGGSLLRGAATVPLKNEVAKQTGKSQIGKNILLGLGLGLTAAPVAVEGYKALRGQQTWGQAGTATGITEGRLLTTIGATALAGGIGYEFMAKPEIKRQLTEGIKNAVQNNQLQIDANGKFTGVKIKNAGRGIESQTIKNTNEGVIIYTKDYGGIEISLNGNSMRAAGGNQIVGKSIIPEYKYRWVDATTGKTSKWIEGGQMAGVEFGMIGKVSGKYTTYKDLTDFKSKVNSALSSGKPLPPGIRTSELENLKTGSWTLVNTGGKKPEYFLVLGKSRESLIGTPGKLNQQGVYSVTKTFKINSNQYDSILKNQMSEKSLLDMIRTQNTVPFSNTYNQPGLELRMRTSQSVDVGKNTVSGTYQGSTSGGAENFIVKVSPDKIVNFNPDTNKFNMVGIKASGGVEVPKEIPGRYVMTKQGLSFKVDGSKVDKDWIKNINNLFKNTGTNVNTKTTGSQGVSFYSGGKLITIVKDKLGQIIITPKSPQTPINIFSGKPPSGVPSKNMGGLWTGGQTNTQGDVMSYTNIGPSTPKGLLPSATPNMLLESSSLSSPSSVLSLLSVAPSVFTPSNIGYGLALPSVPNLFSSRTLQRNVAISRTDFNSRISPLVESSSFMLSTPTGLTGPDTLVNEDSISSADTGGISDILSPVDYTGRYGSGYSGMYDFSVPSGVGDTTNLVPDTEYSITSPVPGYTPNLGLTGIVRPEFLPILPALWLPSRLPSMGRGMMGSKIPVKSKSQINPVADWRIFFNRKFGFLGDPTTTRKVDIYTSSSSDYDVGEISKKIAGMLK